MEPIETRRLLIRYFCAEDLSDLHAILGDDETMRLCEPAYDFEKARAFLYSFCIDQKGAVAAVDKHSRKVIGYLLFHETIPHVYEMGWFFNRGYWHQGYAYEACKALIDHAFDECHAHKVFAETIDPIRSVGLMKKLGMILEGVQRSHTTANDGAWSDLYLYGMLRNDWKQMQTEGESQ